MSSKFLDSLLDRSEKQRQAIRCLHRTAPLWCASHAELCNNDDEPRNLRSLQDLCARKLVSKPSLLVMCDVLPQRLMDCLMTTALEEGRIKSLGCLLDSWKSRKCCLRLPPVLKNRRFLLSEQNHAHLRDLLSNVLQCTLFILHHTIDKLYCNRRYTPIRCLDFSEVLVQEDILHKMCSLINECSGKRCFHCGKLHTMSSLGGEHCCCDYCDKLIVKVNCALDISPISELCDALFAARNGSFSVELVIMGYHMYYSCCACRK